jgi:hypothetical protein
MDKFFVPSFFYYMMIMGYKKQCGTMEHDQYLLNAKNE